MTAFGTRSSLVVFSEAQEGDRRSMDRFIQENALLVHKIVNRYPRAESMKDDLFQEGCIGLLTALKKFDVSRRLRFSTYAVPWIRVRIERYIQANSSVVSMSTRTQILALKVMAMTAHFSVSEIAESLSISREAVESLCHVHDSVSELDYINSSENTETQAINELIISKMNRAFNSADKMAQDALLVTLDLHPEYDNVSQFVSISGIPRHTLNKTAKALIHSFISSTNPMDHGETP